MDYSPGQIAEFLRIDGWVRCRIVGRSKLDPVWWIIVDLENGNEGSCHNEYMRPLSPLVELAKVAEEPDG